MTRVHAWWLVAGILLGLMHTAALWHAAKRPQARIAVAGFVRILIVAVGFAAAAVWGGIFPAFIG
jgi:hypothetical protein